MLEEKFLQRGLERKIAESERAPLSFTDRKLWRRLTAKIDEGK
jgi:hypothetical protein